MAPHYNAAHSPKSFAERIANSAILGCKRRGKFVVIDLKREGVRFHLLVHLRMSGHLDVVSGKTDISKHDRVILHLQDGRQLRFNDVRKFGRMWLVEDAEAVLGALGLEPLSPEFSPAALRNLFKNASGKIKPLLLKQDRIAGIGNIYADEALWRACIHPESAPACLSNQQASDLHRGIVSVLREAIMAAGTDFGDGVVYGGNFTPQVYGRGGELCFRCNGKIRKIVVGQRGTHFCPTCQRRQSAKKSATK